jgi:hypothetical protein
MTLAPPRTTLLCLAIMAATAAVLFAMGRIPICECGYVKLWQGVGSPAETSQHLTDWYTPSHIIHGFLFYAAWRAARRLTGVAIPLAYGLIAAFALECAWEIAENTPWVINRYRDSTIAVGYTGDSIVNSMGDIAAMAFGFLLAALLPVWLSIALVIAAEFYVGWLIRDNLTLNVIMLLWPMDWIKAWQAGAT